MHTHKLLCMYVQVTYCTHINGVVMMSLQEKETALSDDYGKDLASVQALQRRHEGFEVGTPHTHTNCYPSFLLNFLCLCYKGSFVLSQNICVMYNNKRTRVQ